MKHQKLTKTKLKQLIEEQVQLITEGNGITDDAAKVTTDADAEKNDEKNNKKNKAAAAPRNPFVIGDYPEFDTIISQAKKKPKATKVVRAYGSTPANVNATSATRGGRAIGMPPAADDDMGPDTDEDGFPDEYEIRLGYDPSNKNSRPAGFGVTAKGEPEFISVGPDESPQSEKDSAKAKTPPKKSRKSRGAYFLRAYRKEYKGKFKEKYGSTGRSAFNDFYADLDKKGIKIKKDRQFGRRHAEAFDKLVGAPTGDSDVKSKDEKGRTVILQSTFNKIMNPAREKYARAGGAEARIDIIRNAINKLEDAFGEKLPKEERRRYIRMIMGR